MYLLAAFATARRHERSAKQIQYNKKINNVNKYNEKITKKY